MVKNRMVRGAVVLAAAVVPLAGVTALAASPAGAKQPKGITCTKLSGSANTNTGADKTKDTVCTGTTGASGKSKGMVTDTTVTVKWANGKSTTYTQSATACRVARKRRLSPRSRAAASPRTPPVAPPLVRP